MSQPQPFSEFMTDRELPLRRFATVLTGDPRTADDIVGDAFSRAAVKWDHIGGCERPYAYVRAMIVNEFLALRRQPPSTPCGELLEVLETGDEAAVDREALDRQLAGLRRLQRAVLVLRFYEQMTEAEIATLLRCSTGRVHRLADRALRHVADATTAFRRLEQLTPYPREVVLVRARAARRHRVSVASAR